MKLIARYSELCAVLLLLLSLYIIFYFYIQIVVIDGPLGGGGSGSNRAGEVDDLLLRLQRPPSSLRSSNSNIIHRHNNNHNHNHFINQLSSQRITIKPFIGLNDELHYYNLGRGTTTATSSTIITPSSKGSSSSSVHNNSNTARNTNATTTTTIATTVASNSTTNSQRQRRRRVLIISAAPRTKKHLIALWSSLECFTLDVDHVVVSAPTWSKPILERFLSKVMTSIPRFSSGEVSLDGLVSKNDRYDVGLWCDALSYMDGVESSSSTTPNNDDDEDEIEGLSSYDEIGLINDSVFALREYTSILDSIQERNVSMTSLSYSLIHPNGYGSEHYWLESVWRGFSKEGIQTFIDYSCRPKATDPLYCPTKMWGRKGCIVENFERQMSRQFPKEKTYGLFPSDVPTNMISWWTNSFHSWVRHPPYWNKLVTEQNFPVSKVNWKGMIDSINDPRLKTCTKFLVGNNNNSNGSDGDGDGDGDGDDEERLLSSWLNGFDFSLAKAAI
jgi:hypothetical protein